MSLALGLLCLAGCKPDPMELYGELREECGVEKGSSEALVSDVHPRRISRDCALALGRAANFSWHTFEDTDGDLAFDYPSNLLQCSIAASFNLVAADFGTVGELSTRMGADNRVGQKVRAWGQEHGNELPAGAMWLWMLSEKSNFVGAVVGGDGRAGGEGSGRESLAFLRISESVFATSSQREVAFACTVIFLHELGHVTGVRHSYTDGRLGAEASCDLDGRGVYFATTAAVLQLLDHTPLPTEDQNVARAHGGGSCAGIIDRSGLETCAGTDIWVGDCR